MAPFSRLTILQMKIILSFIHLKPYRLINNVKKTMMRGGKNMNEKQLKALNYLIQSCANLLEVDTTNLNKRLKDADDLTKAIEVLDVMELQLRKNYLDSLKK